jgi:hypothetical protein
MKTKEAWNTELEAWRGVTVPQIAAIQADAIEACVCAYEQAKGVPHHVTIAHLRALLPKPVEHKKCPTCGAPG